MKNVIISTVFAISCSYSAALADPAPCGTPLPVSAGDGMVSGVPIGNGIVRYWAQDALLNGFDYFSTLHAYFPLVMPQSGSLAQYVVNAAYAINGTITWYNVVVPVAGKYKVKFRYAFAYGLFPGVTDRSEGIKVNGVIADRNMHFYVTGSFGIFCHSAINVNLEAGRNVIQMFNISEHG